MDTTFQSPIGVDAIGVSPLPLGDMLAVHLPARSTSDALRLAAPNANRLVSADAARGGYGARVHSSEDDLLTRFAVNRVDQHAGVNVAYFSLV
jgi:hypothetical protein